MDLKQLDFVPAYLGANCGITHTKTTGNVSGIYFIKENDVLVYIGMSNFNVKKVLYRHFQKWNPDKWRSNHYRVSYDKNAHKYEVAVLLLDNEVLKTEEILISIYQPRDNRKIMVLEDGVIRGLIKEGIYVSNEDLPF